MAEMGATRAVWKSTRSSGFSRTRCAMCEDHANLEQVVPEGSFADRKVEREKGQTRGSLQCWSGTRGLLPISGHNARRLPISALLFDFRRSVPYRDAPSVGLLLARWVGRSLLFHRLQQLENAFHGDVISRKRKISPPANRSHSEPHARRSPSRPLLG